MTKSTMVRRFGRNASGVLAVLAGIALVADVAAIVRPSIIDISADAAQAGTAPDGVVVIDPVSGPLSTDLRLAPDPSPAVCPGDSIAGYRAQTFISTTGNDPATFTYNSQGPVVPGGGTGVTFPLVSTSGVTQVNINTAVSTGQIVSIPLFDLAAYGSLLVDGSYSIGFACTLAGVTESFWVSTISVESGSFVEISTTTTTTTTTTIPEEESTTTTTLAGGTTTTTLAGGTTTTVAEGPTSATVTPSSPTPGGAYSVGFPNCTVGETITFRQPESTPTSVTGVCQSSSALTSGGVSGFRRPLQAITGTATGSFTAAPRAAGSYTVTMTGTASAQRTTTFVVVGASTPVTGGNSSANTGGSPTGSATGTIPSTGSSTTSLIVWGVLLLVFGRMAILLGRKPKVLSGT